MMQLHTKRKFIINTLKLKKGLIILKRAEHNLSGDRKSTEDACSEFQTMLKQNPLTQSS